MTHNLAQRPKDSGQLKMLIQLFKRESDFTNGTVNKEKGDFRLPRPFIILTKDYPGWDIVENLLILLLLNFYSEINMKKQLMSHQ